jgi:putative ABC transport system permease protein
VIAVFLNALDMAVKELSRNITRTALTSLGILIGVGAVIAMVGLGTGATRSIENDLASMGVNLLFVSPGTGGGPHGRTPAPPFTVADAKAIESQVAHVAAVAPVANAPTTAIRGDLDWDTTINGSTRSWLDTLGRSIGRGRVFSEGEERSGAAVCVLGQTVVEELFDRADPLGEEIRLGKVACTVIGVLAAEGENTMGMDQDDSILMPLSTVQRRFLGTTDVPVLYVSADSPETMSRVAGGIDVLLRERRHITGDTSVNYSINDTQEIANMVGGITSILTMFLAAVAGVSLLVGGIGIMNIMLVSVTERTREIGIRMSIGALGSDVMTQFLVEAVVLSAFGGIMGVVVGVIGTWIGAYAIGIPFVLDPPTILLAVGFSALMGVAFGYWPAQRAARLEPIDALRHT